MGGALWAVVSSREPEGSSSIGATLYWLNRYDKRSSGNIAGLGPDLPRFEMTLSGFAC